MSDTPDTPRPEEPTPTPEASAPTTPAPDAPAATPPADPQPSAESPTTSSAPAASGAPAVAAPLPAVAVGSAMPGEQQDRTHRVPATGLFWGTGRRKTAVARCRLIPGDGKILINKRELEQYFSEVVDRANVTAPLQAVGVLGRYNVFVNVRGGGPTGQSGAIRLGVARALVRADNRSEGQLREHGYLTRDSREVERKKYGRRKARRRFQFSKR